MKTEFNFLIKSRAITLNAINGLTLEQLHKIPDGFNNNIAWNIAHLVVTQQLLHYKMAGLNCLCPDYVIEKFKKGTFPTTNFTQEELDEMIALFIGLPETLQEDYEAGIFENYNEYPTSTGYVITSIESAIAFNNFHEGIHYGIIRSLIKLV